MAVSAGKMTSEEISIAPIIRMPRTTVTAVSTAIKVLYSQVQSPVALAKDSSKVTVNSRRYVSA